MNLAMHLSLTDTASPALLKFRRELQNLQTFANQASNAIQSLQSSITGLGSSAGNASRSLSGLNRTMSSLNANTTRTSTAMINVAQGANAIHAGAVHAQQGMNALIGTMRTAAQQMTRLAASMGQVSASAAGLGSVSTGLSGIGTSAQNSTNHVNGLTQSLKGMAQIWGAMKIQEGLKGSVSAASEYEKTVMRLNALGMDEDTRNAYMFSSQKLSKEIPSLDLNEALELQLDLRSTAGSDVSAIKLASEIAKAVVVMKSAFNSGGKQWSNADNVAIGKLIEQYGAAGNEKKTQELLDALTRITVVTQGRVGPANMAMQAQYIRGGAFAQMNKNSLYTIASQAEMVSAGRGNAGQIGTMTTSANQAFVAGKMLQKALPVIQRLGLLDDKAEMIWSDDGHYKGAAGAPIVDVKLWQEDQVAWVEKYLIPALARQGKTDPKDAIQILNSIMGNRMAATNLANMTILNPQIKKDRHLYEQAKPYEQIYEEMQKMSSVNFDILKAAVSNLSIAFGTHLLPHITTATIYLTEFISMASEWAKDNKTEVTIIGIGAALLSVMMIIRGILALSGVTSLMSMLGITAGGTFARISSAAGSAVSFVLRAFSAMFPAVAAGFSSMWLSIKAGFAAGWAAIKLFFVNLVTNSAAAFARFMAGFGLTKVAILAGAKLIAIGVASFFTFSWAIDAMEEAGLDMRTWANGVAFDMLSAFEKAANKIRNSLYSVAKGAGQLAKDAGADKIGSWLIGFGDWGLKKSATSHAEFTENNRRLSEANKMGSGKDGIKGLYTKEGQGDAKAKEKDEKKDGQSLFDKWKERSEKAEAELRESWRLAQEKLNQEFVPSEGPTPPEGRAGRSAARAAAKAISDMAQIYADQAKTMNETWKMALESQDQLFNAGKLSIADYFSTRAAIITAGTQQEIELMEKQKAELMKDPKANAKGIEKVSNDIDVKRMEMYSDLAKDNIAREKALYELRKAGRDLDIEIYSLTGDGMDAKLAALDEEIAKRREIFALNNDTASLEKLKRIESIQKSKLFYEDASGKLSKEKAKYDLEEARIQADVEMGNKTSMESQHEIVELRRREGEYILQNIDKLRMYAAATEDQSIKDQVENMALEAEKASKALTAGAQEMKSTVKGAFESLFDGLINRTKSLKDLILDFGNSIASAVTSKIAGNMADTITNKVMQPGGMLDGMFGAILGGSAIPGMGGDDQKGGGGNLIADAATSVAQALGFMQKTGVEGTTDAMVKGIAQSGLQMTTTQTAAMALQNLAMAAQSAAMSLGTMGGGGGVASQVAGAAGGGGGGFLSGIGNFFSSAVSGVGNFFSSLLSFDVGADNIPRDMVAKIHKGEMILPAGAAERVRSGGMGGSMSITNNFTVNGPTDRQTQEQLAAKVAQSLQRAQRRNR